MFVELEKGAYDQLDALLYATPPDPMMHMVLEGNRSGRIFVNRLPDPSVALIWTGMEYAYLVGEPAGARKAVVQIVVEIILPALDEVGMGFVTIFPYGVEPDVVQGWFPKHWSVSFGVNAYMFDRERFEVLRARTRPLPPGYERVRLDGTALAEKACQGVREDILFCWDTLERFEVLGRGYCIQQSQEGVVSACYAIAFGANAYHINIWTHPGHRRKGLARHAASAFLDECLPQGRMIYWINDAPNTPSRRLAESLGYRYAGDLATVDIPVHPHHFHLGLAEHFSDYLGLYRQAGELYDMAFAIQDGSAGSYRKAARVWRQAGEPGKADQYERQSIT